MARLAVRWQRLLHNPVAVKELRSRMRGRRAVVTLSAYLLLLSGLVTLVYLLFVAQSRQLYGPEPRMAGKSIFTALIAVEVFLVVFIGPAFTASAVSGERERQTYDLLRTTLLPAGALVQGKLLSALGYVVLLLLATAPLHGMAFLLGGVAPVEIVVSQLVLLVAAVTFAQWGLFASTVVRTTIGSTVMTFAGSLLLLIGLPLLALFMLPLLATITLPLPGGLGEILGTYAGLLASTLNLPAALIVSDLILVENNAVFVYQDMIGGRSVWFFSPWWPHIVIYGLLAVLLFWLSVRRVRRLTSV